MFKGEVKINYGKLGTVASQVNSYRNALTDINSALMQIDKELEYEHNPKSLEKLREIQKEINNDIFNCLCELGGLDNLLSGYVYDMENILPAINNDQNIVVDKSDIYQNVISMQNACLSIYNVQNAATMFTTQGLGKTNEEKEKMKKNYSLIVDTIQIGIFVQLRKRTEYIQELLDYFYTQVQNYENVDDDYTTRARGLMYTEFSVSEFGAQVAIEIGDAALGIVKGIGKTIIEMAQGIVTLAAIPLILGVYENIFAGSLIAIVVSKDPPNWAKEGMEISSEFFRSLADPWEMVEGMCQDFNDAHEKEGIWYTGAYVVANVVGVELIMGKVGVLAKLTQSPVDNILFTIGKIKDPELLTSIIRGLDTETLLSVINKSEGKSLEAIIKAMDDSQVEAIMKACDEDMLKVIQKVRGIKTLKGAKGLFGTDFEEYLTKNIGGNGSFSVGGRDFDGGIGKRWWEAKSGPYWENRVNDPKAIAKFKSDMGDRLKIAEENGATYELFSNTPIPEVFKVYLDKKGIPYTEILE